MSPPTRKGGQERENAMRKLLFVIALMSAGRVWAIAPIGPAASTLEKGQLEVGFDYAHTKFDDLPIDATLKSLVSTWSRELSMDDTANGYWAKVGYGLLDPLDIFLRFGAADLEDADAEFAWGLGARATVIESEHLDWGLLAQATWFASTYEGTRSLDPYGPIWEREDFDYAVFQIAAGPVYKADGVSVYGGPFLYWLRFDGDARMIVLSDGTTFNATADAESDVEFGAYVGLLVDLGDALSVGAEAQLATHSQTFCFNVTCRF